MNSNYESTLGNADDETKDLRFSVIIPLEYHRGQVEVCLRLWTQEQVYPRNQYEIIAVGCRYSLDEDRCAFFENLLGPNDRLLLFDEPHDMALCAHAVDYARGSVLFFTESHCLPEPNALSLAELALSKHPEWAGFSCYSKPITHNPLSIAEAEMYDADIQYGMNEHPWRKILDQCFVVRLENYHNAGGFNPALGHFAEWYLAAKMHQKNYQIGYAPEVQYKHYYSGDLQELIEFTADFAHGEMITHLKWMDDTLHPYFDAPPEWRARYQWVPALAHKVFDLACNTRQISLSPRQWIGDCRLLLVTSLRAGLNVQPALVLASLRLKLTNWGLRLAILLGADRQTLLAFFVRMVDAVVRLERTQFIAHWLAGDQTAPTLMPVDGFLWRPDLSHSFHAIGFHAPEISLGRSFCWSEPVGMVIVSLLPGKYSINMEWLPITPIKNLKIYLDEKPLPLVQKSCTVSTPPFDVSSTTPVRLAWTCESTVALDDPRLFGIAVSSISVQPVSS